jgi:hypothetical protein
MEPRQALGLSSPLPAEAVVHTSLKTVHPEQVVAEVEDWQLQQQPAGVLQLEVWVEMAHHLEQATITAGAEEGLRRQGALPRLPQLQEQEERALHLTVLLTEVAVVAEAVYQWEVLEAPQLVAEEQAEAKSEALTIRLALLVQQTLEEAEEAVEMTAWERVQQLPVAMADPALSLSTTHSRRLRVNTWPDRRASYPSPPSCHKSCLQQSALHGKASSPCAQA